MIREKRRLVCWESYSDCPFIIKSYPSNDIYQFGYFSLLRTISQSETLKCGCLNYIFLEYYLASNMENHVTSASLKLKLTLLKALKEGNVEQSQQLLEQLSTINHSHP